MLGKNPRAHFQLYTYLTTAFLLFLLGLFGYMGMRQIGVQVQENRRITLDRLAHLDDLSDSLDKLFVWQRAYLVDRDRKEQHRALRKIQEAETTMFRAFDALGNVAENRGKTLNRSDLADLIQQLRKLNNKILELSENYKTRALSLSQVDYRSLNEIARYKVEVLRRFILVEADAINREQYRLLIVYVLTGVLALCIIVVMLAGSLLLRERAKRALSETEERYRVLFNSGNDAVFVHEIEKDGRVGPFLEVNDVACRRLGYGKEEILRLSPLEIDAPEDLEKIPKHIHELKEKGRVLFETTHLAKDGRRIPVEINAQVFTFQGMSAVLSIARDITDRKRAEQAMKESEERYRSLVENTLDGYFICEIPSGRFIFLNQRICDIAGYTMQEGLNRTLWDVVDPEEHKIIGERIQSRIEGKASSYASNIYGAIRKDGSKFRAEVSTSLVTYQGKSVMQGVLRDVTEEEKLQLQLQHAHKMEAIGTLAGGIAHDFNNLLMGIQGRTSLMMTEMEPSHPLMEHLEGIEEYIKGATELTKQLLGFAKGGKYEVKPTDLNDLIENSAQLFGRTKKEISIYYKFQRDLWSVEADQRQIEQVLLNLYVNAWQAMPAGGELYLQTENTTIDEGYAKTHFVEPGKYVKISITDTGVGMDEATRQKVFDPFFTTKEMGRGTGLGLASAFGIISNHGGIINVYSEKGEGTTFSIYLPASEKEIIQEKESVAEISRGSETILLVDDEQMVLDVAEPMLEKLGYKVMDAKSGWAAIELYQEKIEEIDIIILDMIMPEMNGEETFDRLKEIDPDVKVLLSSGYSINGQAQEILRRGCHGFIQKPFKLNQLSQKLREILDKGL